MVTIYTIGEYLQICTIIPVTIGGICMIIQYQRASFYHHHNLKLRLGHGLLRLTIMMTTILFAIDAFQLWLPIPINYLIDYTLTEFCIICCGLYVRILLLTCYKGVLRVRIPHILTFRHMLLFSTLFVLFSTIPILIAIVYNTIRMTLWFFVLQAIGCFTIVTLGSTVYIILWRTVTQSASLVGRIGYTHLSPYEKKFVEIYNGLYDRLLRWNILNETGSDPLKHNWGTIITNKHWYWRYYPTCWLSDYDLYYLDQTSTASQHDQSKKTCTTPTTTVVYGI